MQTIQDFMRRKSQLALNRSSWESQWKDLADYLIPGQTRFNTSDNNRGDKKNTRIIDSTATLALRTLSAGMMSGITSPARPWFQLKVEDPGLNQYRRVRIWLDQVRDIMNERFLASNLYTTLPNTYRNLGVFGVDAFAVLDDAQDGLRCYSFPMGSYYLGTSYRGNIDTCYRDFQMTPRQMAQQLGRDNLSGQAKGMLDNGSGDSWLDITHCIEPNPDFVPGKSSRKNKPFISVYFETGANDGKFLSVSGYDSFPVMAPRWDVIGTDIYGHSPGMDALGDIKALQLEQKRKAQGLDKAVNPPMGAPSSLKSGRASQLPGDVTFYDATTGSNGFAPLYQVALPYNELLEDIGENQKRIGRVFFEDLFLMISQDDRSNVTAQEIIARKEEKLLMLGPVYTRLNDELLDPLIDRTFNLLLEAGELPPPPPEIVGQEIGVEFVSIMAQAMKLAGIQSVERITAYTGNLAAAYPDALDALNPDQAIDEMADALSVPPTMLRSQEERDAIRAQRAQQQQAMQAAQMAQGAAQTAQTLSQTSVTDPSALTALMAQMRGV